MDGLPSGRLRGLVVSLRMSDLCRTLVGMHAGERWRLGHRPALDGLRGIAVLLVVLAHGQVPHLPGGGEVGVAAFFTLSGFLITSLLLDDIHGHGRVRVARFYTRRALRLLPAVFALVAVVVTIGWLVPNATQVPSVLGTLFYGNNIVMAAGHVWEGDWLGHTWSLSIEEQFYLLWPLALVFLARRGRRVMVACTAALIIASFGLRVALWDPITPNGLRLYAGLDTRADGLLVGCLLAMLMRRIVVQRARPLFVLAGALLLAIATQITTPAGTVIVIPALVSIGAAAIIFGAAQGAGSRPLEGRWLRWVGERSYGMYLWHFPIACLLRFQTDLTWWQALPILAVGTLALTVLSWRYVEQPFLRLKDSRERRWVVQRPRLEVLEVR